jgi:DNA-binding transcriptional MerR regulator/methylmalonyl-CoA mutase cobalamin-binding subunit
MPPPSSELRHPIKVVCRRTGLSAHVIRVWEKRYGLVCCQRSDSNRRLYSDAMIERLRLLKDLTGYGHRISQIACLCLDDLRKLHAKELPADAPPPPPEDFVNSETDDCITRCMAAVRQLDALALTNLLEDARQRHGQRGALLHVIIPLMHEVGDAWKRGELRAACEHVATNAVRDFIALGARNYSMRQGAPEIVVTTPVGQVHELGALLATAAARDMGWRSTYLGPALPAGEIAACAATRQARAVALSVVFPCDDPNVTRELARLRKLLPPHVAMLIGGAAAKEYYDALKMPPEVHLVRCLKDYEDALLGLHKPSEHGT